MGVGKLLSYWDGNFSGAMLNFGRVSNYRSATFVMGLKSRQLCYKLVAHCKPHDSYHVLVGLNLNTGIIEVKFWGPSARDEIG